MTGERATDRRVLAITGQDREHFLQGLVTNDVRRLAEGAVYAALLTPQGKYLADFFLVPAPEGDAILIDVKDSLADALLRRLSMYRLRADVVIAPSDIVVERGLGPVPEGAFADPRDPGLGWRRYSRDAGAGLATPGTDWEALRIAACVPEAGVELIPEDSYILEAGFERLHGVDFRKGCYVGQEVTARMKHKTELRKGIVPVRVDGAAPVGTEITTADGKPAGTLYSQAGGRGIAFLRFDRAEGALTAGPAAIHRA